MTSVVFGFSQYWWLYAGFLAFVIGMLALDLGVFHRKAHSVSMREAATWSVVWFVLALVFSACLYYFCLSHLPQQPHFQALGLDVETFAKQMSLEFLTGFLIEKSLAIDNIFVFVMVFSFFSIPINFQHRVLFYGIFGALIFRGIFIALGSVLMQFHWMLWIFGAFLILTGIKMLWMPEQKMDPNKNWVIRFLRKTFPVTNNLSSGRFTIMENGRRVLTPLFIALIFLELTDVIFALDSVPAIFAVTREPMIVFTSNIFAIMGLRSLYFLLAGVIDKFHLLRYGLAAVLIFVGLKMVWLNPMFDGKFPISWSLGVIGLFIGTSVLASLVFPAKQEQPSTILK